MTPKSLVSTTPDSGAYTDLTRLSSLKHGDRDSDANVRKVAQEFESLFISEMLKASRKASNVMADDNPMNTETVKQYQDMYDQQMSVSMSREGGGIGLQDVLVRQLSQKKASAAAAASAASAHAPA
ncbi:rod-binding protein, partial [Pseudomonas sp.]|uniref:rod-binding protein n=1 Tax=Pseudomonas sp. TaxID=306 RepID=UPI0028AAA0E0